MPLFGEDPAPVAVEAAAPAPVALPADGPVPPHDRLNELLMQLIDEVPVPAVAGPTPLAPADPPVNGPVAPQDQCQGQPEYMCRKRGCHRPRMYQTSRSRFCREHLLNSMPQFRATDLQNGATAEDDGCSGYNSLLPRRAPGKYAGIAFVRAAGRKITAFVPDVRVRAVRTWCRLRICRREFRVRFELDQLGGSFCGGYVHKALDPNRTPGKT
ncbi:hypothetical protein B0T20DRAFT_392400 [Sordaria brevicollis]|uniref:Uncharacterized protein n=1 Tax=Sordaria brevicollis TaxID=83679 RepID=A0AAE0PGG8_SORBR|nr:hypothetical protein B0T20DRAFT_392400 [Sordaria brevicollis]